MSEGNGDERASEPAALVAAVLNEESRRQGEARDDLAVDVASLPGVGGDAVALRSVLTHGNRALLLTMGATWGLGFGIFSMTALLAAKIAHHYDFSFRFLVATAVLPGFTIVLVSQPLGNYANRPTTEPPAGPAVVARGLGVRPRALGCRVRALGAPRRARVHRRRRARHGPGAELAPRRRLPDPRPANRVRPLRGDRRRRLRARDR